VALGEEIVPQAELRRTESYHDFLKPHDMEWMVTTALFDGNSEGPATHMSFTRHLGREAYDGESKQLIELLAPHVRHALLTHWRLTEARLGTQAQETALDHLGYGVILLDAEGQAVYLNPLAETLLHRNDGIDMRDGRPRSLRGDEDQALTRLVHQAVLGVGGGMSVTRRVTHYGRQQPPYRLSATPIRLDSPPTIPGVPVVPARVLLLVRDPDHDAGAAGLRSLTRLYHITAAEQRVLELLLQGMAPKAIAERLHVSVRTVRSQLSSLYAKTSTRGQRELVALALRRGHQEP
jgi:DNA-binding CsgD family transcriptional regulator